MKKRNILLSSVAAFMLIGTNIQADEATNIESVDVWETQIESSSLNLGTDSIETKQADHLSDLLRDLPGVDVGGTHSINNRINIRGLQDEDLDITLDGAKVQNANMFHHIGNLLINPDILKKASIQVGTNSVVNGSLGGSVAFETKDGRDMLEKGKDFGARFSTTYNSNASLGGSVSVYGNILENADFMLYHNYVHNKDTKDGAGTKLFGKDGKVNNTLAKFGYNLSDNQRISFSYDKLTNEGDYLPRPDMYAYNIVRTGYGGTFDTAYDRDTFTFKHELDLGDDLFLNTTLYSNTNQLVRYEKSLNGSAPRPGASSGLLDGIVKTVGINLKAQSILEQENIAHILTYGALYDKQTSEVTWDGAKYGEDEEAKTTALFLEDTLDFNNGFLLTPGVRFNHYDFDGAYGKIKDNEFTYGLESEYKVNKNFTLLASMTTLFKGVEMLDVLATNRLNSSATNSANIKSETGINKELGFKYLDNNVKGADSIGFSFKYFNTEINDYITNEWGPGWAYNYMKNNGDLNIKGFEASFTFSKDSFSSLLTYAHSASKFESTGRPTASQPGDSVSLSLDYKINNQLSASWESIFVKEQDKIASPSAPIVYTTKDGYSVHDIALNYKPSSVKGLTVIAGIDNIFDKTYVSHTSLNATVSGTSGYDYEPGRNVKVTLAYKF